MNQGEARKLMKELRQDEMTPERAYEIYREAPKDSLLKNYGSLRCIELMWEELEEDQGSMTSDRASELSCLASSLRVNSLYRSLHEKYHELLMEDLGKDTMTAGWADNIYEYARQYVYKYLEPLDRPLWADSKVFELLDASKKRRDELLEKNN